MRGQLSEAEILICRRKPRLTGLGRTEGSGGSAPPGSTLQCHTSGERRPGLRPGTAGSHPGRPPGHAAGIGRVRGGSEQPAGPPQRRATRPAGKRRAKARKGETGQGQRGARASPAAPLGRAGRSHHRAVEPVPFSAGSIGTTARRLAAPATVQTRPRAWPRRACARGPCRGRAAAERLRSRGPDRKWAVLRPAPALSGAGKGLAQSHAAGNSVTQVIRLENTPEIIESSL